MMKDIFQIRADSDFKQKCLDTFHYQYENVEVYRKFVDFLKIDASTQERNPVKEESTF